MGTLYVDRKGVELRLSGAALEVRNGDGLVRTIPARLLERVVLRADTRLSSSVIAGLADMGVGLLALGGRGGQRVAHLLGAPAGDARARIAQCQRVNDEAFASDWTRSLLRGKLRGQQRFLVRALNRRPDLRKPLTDSIETIRLALDRLPAAEDRAALRGLEGSAAAAYWRAYATLMPDSLGFAARRRRPPPDPVNVCLSLGYTLLHSQAVQACWAAGLDPLVGFLHLPAFGRESLACDLVEPWRVYVDAWVWELFRDKSLRAEHFGRDGGGACLLGKTGRAHFYAGWSGLQPRLGRALLRHARMTARTLAGAVTLPDVEGDGFDEPFLPGNEHEA